MSVARAGLLLMGMVVVMAVRGLESSLMGHGGRHIVPVWVVTDGVCRQVSWLFGQGNQRKVVSGCFVVVWVSVLG